MGAAEQWRPVSGHEGAYEVSDRGRVRSLDRVHTYERVDQYSGRMLTVRRVHRGKMLRPGAQQSGHLSVVLGRGNTRSVHILVLEAFVGPRPGPQHEGLHWDDDTKNNALPNLRWGTRGDNLRDAARNGRTPTGERHPHAKLSEVDVRTIRANLGSTPIAALARQYGVSWDTIWSIKTGRSWKHDGRQEIAA